MSNYYQFLFEADDKNENSINQQNYNEYKFEDLRLENKVKYIGFALNDANIRTKCEPNKNSNYDSDYIFQFENEKDLEKAKYVLRKVLGLNLDSNFFELDDKVFSLVSQKNNGKRTFFDKVSDLKSQQDSAAHRFLNRIRVKQYRYV